MRTTELAAGGPLAPRERTLPALLGRQAQVHGERPLVAIEGAAWSHRGARDAAARRGAALRAAGVGRGDRVAILCGNRAEHLETFLGCGWIGAVAVPINTASMGPQIGYVLAHSGARLLVAEAALLPRLEAAGLGDDGALAAVLVVGGEVPASAGGVPCAPWPAADEEAAP